MTTTPPTPLRVLALNVENYKRLTAVQIRPDGDVVLVGGRNAQGKTSVLDAIYAVLKGGAAARETVQPIRDGQDTAVARLEIGDEHGNVVYVATRRWTKEDAGTLTVESSDHARFSSPQKLLDGLLGGISLDPLAFTRMDAKQQLRTLVDALGDSLGFNPVTLEAERKGVYDRRTEVGRKVTELEGRLKGYPEPDPSLPAEQASAADLVAQVDAMTRQNRAIDAAVEQAKQARADQQRAAEALAAAQEALSAATARATETVTAARAIGDRQDPQALLDQLGEIDVVNERVRKQRDRAAVAEELSDRKQEQAQHTLRLEEIAKQKADGIAAAKLPVPGLGFDADGVTLNGIPFSQASTAEQVRVSTALGMAGSPTIRVMRIDGGESLDSDSLAIIEKLAAEHQYQVWISRVDESRSVGFTIEDGEVVA
ncbi:AAA family ATPase [Curtobacterium sp. VKM Ac-2884]|uniref:AAA family ATPase n=1 Tax=Curtobacterium sp. VKM Ac-2884 TaxID=2783818 RepID=UPI00188B6900|nr:AAA family ATPase [Curtobacterium sp. VKM Ac-2884]MBF4602797.1 AAA family ATPase [Curtobacterium sp. VKM Ac-2884]